MENTPLLSLALFAGMVLSGCAAQNGWSPTVDTYGDPNAQRISADQLQCQHLAKQASGDTTTQAAEGTLVGGLLGAATGAAIGAATGNTSRGAVIGATAGGVGGGLYKATDSNRQYKIAYRNCMSSRGHRVIN